MNTPANTSARPPSKRTIGLLADWFDERYQFNILTTAQEATAQRACDLLAFAGGIPGSTERDSDQRARAFRLAAPQNIDGVILLAGTMVNALGSEGLVDLLRGLEGIPACAIGVQVPGVPSVVVDNQSGIDQAMNHLVTHHRCREVAFIRGPNKNKEAESRFAAYRAALAQAEIAYDPALVFQGNFLHQSGSAAIAHFHSQGIHPKAIIAANDEMALGALEALAVAGVRVPEDTRVVGFDDIQAARYGSPPLTTVKQPMSELAVAAVRTVMDQIHGREVPSVQMLQTHLVVRDSCGCTVRLTSSGRSFFPEIDRGDDVRAFGTQFAEARPALRAELARIARGEFLNLRDWENVLIDSFIAQVEGEEDPFVQRLGQYLSKTASSDGDVNRFQDVITAFRRSALPCCQPRELATKVENVLQEARLVTALATDRAQAKRHMSLERYTRVFAEVAAALTGAFDWDQLDEVVNTELPRIGVVGCYVAVHNQDGAVGPGVPAQAKLVAAYADDKARADLRGALGVAFDTHALMPDSLLPSEGTHQMAVLPLFLKGQDLGYCVVKSRKSESDVLELLRQQLSVAVYGCQLRESRK